MVKTVLTQQESLIQSLRSSELALRAELSSVRASQAEMTGRRHVDEQVGGLCLSLQRILSDSLEHPRAEAKARRCAGGS
jgi:hypothetical protein